MCVCVCVSQFTPCYGPVSSKIAYLVAVTLKLLPL